MHYAFLVIDDKTGYVENTKESTTRINENVYSKSQDIRSWDKNQLFLDAKIWKTKFRKIVSLRVTSKSLKYLQISLTKDLQDLYNEIYKALLKERGS